MYAAIRQGKAKTGMVEELARRPLVWMSRRLRPAHHLPSRMAPVAGAVAKVVPRWASAIGLAPSGRRRLLTRLATPSATTSSLGGSSPRLSVFYGISCGAATQVQIGGTQPTIPLFDSGDMRPHASTHEYELC